MSVTVTVDPLLLASASASSRASRARSIAG